MAEERKELDIVPSSSKTIEEALGGVQIELSKIQQQRELPEVPGFTKEELELRDIRQRSHGGIYYAQERTNRHMIAQVSLYVIYEIGRYIMNEGKATGYIAESYVEDLLLTSPLGLRLSKEALNMNLDAPSLEAAIAMEDRNQILCAQTEDFKTAAMSFFTKQAPEYKNA